MEQADQGQVHEDNSHVLQEKAPALSTEVVQEDKPTENEQYNVPDVTEVEQPQEKDSMEGGEQASEEEKPGAEKETLLQEIASLREENKALLIEKDVLLLDMETLKEDKKALLIEKAALLSEKQSLAEEKNALMKENDTLAQQKKTLGQENKNLTWENQKMRSNLLEYQKSLDQCEMRQD